MPTRDQHSSLLQIIIVKRFITLCRGLTNKHYSSLECPAGVEHPSLLGPFVRKEEKKCDLGPRGQFNDVFIKQAIGKNGAELFLHICLGESFKTLYGCKLQIFVIS
jgi:hypothetical protein